MIAEFYADWAHGRRDAPAGPLLRAVERIRSFFRAVASALRGEGFQDASWIMEHIADGEIGGRGPDCPGGGYVKGPPRLVEKFTGIFGDFWGGMPPQPRRGDYQVSTGKCRGK